MKDKNTKQPSPLSSRMVEDDATEKLKKRLRDMGLIVNASVGKAPELTRKKSSKK